MNDKEPKAMEAEKLPASSPSTSGPVSTGSAKSGGNKKVLIACGVIAAIIACIICVAVVVAGGSFASLLSMFKNSDALVEYNNQAVDERDKVVEQLYETTNSFYYALDLSEIDQAVKDLDAAISTAETTINGLSVPNGGDPLKDLNSQYLGKMKELSQLIKDATKSADSVYDISEETYDQYQTKLEEIDALNIQIAKKLNEIVGYDAVPQSEIDKLENDQNQ